MLAQCLAKMGGRGKADAAMGGDRALVLRDICGYSTAVEFNFNGSSQSSFSIGVGPRLLSRICP